MLCKHSCFQCKILHREVGVIISERIKELREQQNLSQADLAKKLNIARTSVVAWENQTYLPSIKHIINMTKLFKVSADYLLEISNERVLPLTDLTEEEIAIILRLTDYFRQNHK